jgi:hypothetical protein
LPEWHISLPNNGLIGFWMATHTSVTGYIGVSLDFGYASAEAVKKGLPIESLDLLRGRGLTFTEMATVIAIAL